MFKNLIEKGFQVLTLHHAEAILSYDMPEAAEELERALVGIELPVVELIEGGGGEGELTQRLRRALSEELGWIKHSFEIKKIVDGKERESVSHEIDHVKAFDKGTVALEIEWNNKDPFFDRDLNNFRLLHELDVLSVGVIITRSTEILEIFRALGRGKSSGASTTHMSKLLPKIEGGGAGGCPVLVLGITKKLYQGD